MEIKLVAYGIAKEILNYSENVFEIEEKSNIHDLKSELVRQYPDFNKLKNLKFAIGKDYQQDDFILSEHDEVVIIPPVSGG